MTVSQDLKFGIAIPQVFPDGEIDPSLISGFVARAESLGYHSCWAQEEAVPAGAGPRRRVPSVLCRRFYHTGQVGYLGAAHRAAKSHLLRQEHGLLGPLVQGQANGGCRHRYVYRHISRLRHQRQDQGQPLRRGHLADQEALDRGLGHFCGALLAVGRSVGGCQTRSGPTPSSVVRRPRRAGPEKGGPEWETAGWEPGPLPPAPSRVTS